MKKWAHVAAVSFLISGFCSSAFAAWDDEAKKLFEKDKYQEVIEMAEPHKKDKDSKMGLMLMAFSHLQLSEFNGTSSDKKAFKNYMELLEDYVNASNLTSIEYFINQVDKPEVVDEARDLLKSAFKNVSNIEEAPLVMAFLKKDDEKTSKLAAAALENMISTKRKYVEKGGTLREQDIAIMQNEKLIRALLENINISDAFSTLEDIEQPVLQYLKNYEGKKITSLEEKINSAIAKREKKYPGSSWYSATGKAREGAQ